MTLDRGAQPHFSRQVPSTRAECDALEIARKRATGELPQPRDEWGNGSRNGRIGYRSRSGTGIGTCIVNDGSGHYAQVHWEGPNFKTFCYIRQPSGRQDDIHGHDVKGWNGIPKWEEETSMSPFKRIAGGRIDIHAPPVQVIRVEEHIIVERQRIFHHVDTDDVHVQENAPTDAQIQIEASHVRAHENHQVIETRVGAKPRGFWTAFVLGPAKRSVAPQQVAPQLAPPQAIDKGMLRPVPQQAGVALPPPERQATPTPAPASGVHALPASQRHAASQPNAPLQLAHQPEQPLPLPAQRKKSWSIL